ncbi:hypothetical protein IMG5_099770 [Ichthyophthirius multifiliis]|uniref:Uncharacterized protein n=1 Tax=Ichthyophthirius multifiliis TaxID=5932 RepID=G0QS84_ICHMU|nr:hypothetical protein IMG5_099770 [Ichthyophthirius multifiliis]EGR31949.1 hypothetical protein IMG5_099770 [Ichthyophthirius multifiliis]|eukprot:XP_004035435.1 hypothetical protein IMG5_099770 [Ichthyophthirius multifiliis]
MDQNVVSSLIWIKKGFAKKNPKEFELNEEQIKQMKNDPLVQKKLGQEDENISDEEEENLPVFTQDINMLKYDDNIDQNGDPIVKKKIYYQIKQNKNKAFDEMSDEEKEDFNIRPTDALIVAAKIVKINKQKPKNRKNIKGKRIFQFRNICI